MEAVTYKDFLAKLRKTPRKWRFYYDSKMIRYHDGSCPIATVIGDSAFSEKSYGLRFRRRVMNAADGHTHSQTRRDLLKACGLKEKP